MITKAIIYCRVSSQRQVEEGHGLDGQEKRCRDYAKAQGYTVVGVFKDEGVSGGIVDREGMQALLNELEQYRNEPDEIVIIIDDIKRFARDVQGHFTLKTAIYSRNARLESPSHRFEDTPEGKFVETVLAGASELERNQNRRQVINRMKARLESGYWPFSMSRGLINQKHPIHGKILVRREPLATIYKEGIEKFRDGLLPTIESFQAFINEKYREHQLPLKMSSHTAKETLKEILYTGYIEYPKWGISRMKAKHEGFITLETYEAVLDRLEGRAKPHRKDYSLDFPLRPLVLCDSCGVPMTGSYHTGRKVRYPHYFCRNNNCEFGNKNIPKDTFEQQFKQLLLGVKPPDELVDLAKDVLLEVWNNRLEMTVLQRGNAKNEIEKLKTEIDEFTNRVVKTEDEILVAIYEGKIKELVEKKKEIERQLPHNPYSDQNFGTALEKVYGAIKKPVQMWESDDCRDKRTIIGMYFENNLRYNYKTGFGTTSLAYPIALITKKPPVKEASVDILPESWNRIEDYIFKWYPVLQGMNLAPSRSNYLSIT